MNARRPAQVYILLSAVMFSSAGLFMGLLHADVWTILFWRSLFALFFTLVLIGIQPDVLAVIRLDRAGLLAAVLSAAATLLFIPALHLTSVANVAVIHGALPLLTVIIFRLVTREPVGRLTFALCAAVALGALVIFAGSASSGTRLLGDGLALLMTTLMALMTVAFRQSNVRSVLGMVAVSNAIAMLFAAGLTPAPAVALKEATILAAFALFQMTFGLLLYAKGAHQLAPAETAMLSLTEVPLSALWVWLAFDQQPAAQTIAGGSLILLAVLFYLLTVLAPMQSSTRRGPGPRE